MYSFSTFDSLESIPIPTCAALDDANTSSLSMIYTRRWDDRNSLNHPAKSLPRSYPDLPIGSKGFKLVHPACNNLLRDLEPLAVPRDAAKRMLGIYHPPILMRHP